VPGGAGGVDRAEVVVFALAAAIGAIGAVDFEDGETGLGQVADQSEAVGAGAFDADAGRLAEFADSGQQRPVAGACGGEATGA
jgi:hypothetical protein